MTVITFTLQGVRNTWRCVCLFLCSRSFTKCATPRRTTRRSGRASAATTLCSVSCPKRTRTHTHTHTHTYIYIHTYTRARTHTHQEGLRGDRAEHLPPHPCVRCHVLNTHTHTHTHTHTRAYGMVGSRNEKCFFYCWSPPRRVRCAGSPRPVYKCTGETFQ